MTWDQLYELANFEQAAVRGLSVIAKEVGISDGQGQSRHTFSVALPVSLDDVPLDSVAFLEDEADGSLATLYRASSDTQIHDAVFGIFYVTCVDGPTYYLDGRAEYPPWWYHD